MWAKTPFTLINPMLPETRSEMALPLKVGERILGVLDVQSTQEAAFGEEDIKALQSLADQVAITLENAQTVHANPGRLGRSSTSLSTIYRARMGQLCGSQRRADRRIRTEFILPGRWLAFAGSEPGVGARPRASSQSPARAARRRWSDPTAQAALVAPIKLRDQIIGALDLREIDHERQWTEDEIALTDAVANQVALAVENARLFEQTQVSLADTRALYEASARINSATTLEDILAALREHTLLGQADKVTALNIFDTPWVATRCRRWLR